MCPTSCPPSTATLPSSTNQAVPVPPAIARGGSHPAPVQNGRRVLLCGQCPLTPAIARGGHILCPYQMGTGCFFSFLRIFLLNNPVPAPGGGLEPGDFHMVYSLIYGYWAGSARFRLLSLVKVTSYARTKWAQGASLRAVPAATCYRSWRSHPVPVPNGHRMFLFVSAGIIAVKAGSCAGWRLGTYCQNKRPFLTPSIFQKFYSKKPFLHRGGTEHVDPNSFFLCKF